MATHGDYERSDARTGPLWIAVIVLALLLLGSMAVSRWIDRGLSAEIERSVAPNPVADLRTEPTTPLLQELPSAELVGHRATEQAALHAPASWIDPVNGIVRIPIDEAVQKVLAEGFPVRTEERR